MPLCGLRLVPPVSKQTPLPTSPTRARLPRQLDPVAEPVSVAIALACGTARKAPAPARDGAFVVGAEPATLASRQAPAAPPIAAARCSFVRRQRRGRQLFPHGRRDGGVEVGGARTEASIVRRSQGSRPSPCASASVLQPAGAPADQRLTQLAAWFAAARRRDGAAGPQGLRLSLTSLRASFQSFRSTVSGFAVPTAASVCLRFAAGPRRPARCVRAHVGEEVGQSAHRAGAPAPFQGPSRPRRTRLRLRWKSWFALACLCSRGSRALSSGGRSRATAYRGPRGACADVAHRHANSACHAESVSRHAPCLEPPSWELQGPCSPPRVGFESIDSMLQLHRRERAHYLLKRVIDFTRRSGAYLPVPAQRRICGPRSPPRRSAEYQRPCAQAAHQGLIRWNAWRWCCGRTDGVRRIGGHISTYASSATLYEVGFNHFFRARRRHTGDMVYFQDTRRPECMRGHSSKAG